MSGPNITLNTIVAEELSKIADQLEADLAAGEDFNKSVAKVVREFINAHKRIIYNDNNYSKEWVREAEKRGLLNLRTTPDAASLLHVGKKSRALRKAPHLHAHGDEIAQRDSL